MQNSTMVLAVFTLLLSGSAFAADAPAPTKPQHFSVSVLDKMVQNTFQSDASDLSLKDFKLQTQKKKISLDGFDVFTTDVSAFYQTSSLTSLQDYVIVQWVKGCAFESTWDGKQLNKYMNQNIPYFGKPSVTAQHKDWEIDTDSTDPVYSSYDGKDRYGYLRWNKDPNSLDPETATFYNDKKPTNPSVFVTDLPGGAYLESTATESIQRAVNTSLNFKTCIYHSSDIPDVTDRTGSNIPKKAVLCYDWNNRIVYNFQLRQMVQPDAIDPFCETTPETTPTKF